MWALSEPQEKLGGMGRRQRSHRGRRECCSSPTEPKLHEVLGQLALLSGSHCEETSGTVVPVSLLQSREF